MEEQEKVRITADAEAGVKEEEEEERIFNQEQAAIPIALFARELVMTLKIVS